MNGNAAGLCGLLGIRHPLLSAPMAGISGAALACAVSQAGGLGFIGGGYGEPDWLAVQLDHCRGTNFGVGFITWALRRQPKLLDLALDARPRTVLLSFGDGLQDFAPAIHDAGALLIAQVQTLRQAVEAAAQGADILVAQGGEGGGHSGVRGTMALVPAVVDAVGPLPVIAAGGIADGRGLAAALMLGAAGALCGTAFYACEESLAHPAAKQRLLEGSGDDTLKSALFDRLRGLDWPDGPWVLRTLRNTWTECWAADMPSLRQQLPRLQSELALARERADFDIAPVIAGEAADLVHRSRPAGELVRDMVRQAHVLLGAAPPLNNV